MFENIVIFTHLVEIGSFSKTAEALNMASSTITRKIQDLEVYFDKLLFLRDTRNVKLTLEGKLVYQKFKKLRSHLNECFNEVNPTHLSNPHY